MKQSRHTLEQIFQTQVDNLSLTLQPFTIVKYQYVARYFVAYLRAEFPEICRLSQLRRDPHMLGFFRWLCELRPPIGNPTRRQRLLCLRRLLNDLADQGHQLQPGLIIPEDLPTLPEYLPRPLSPEDDHRLQDELRRKDDLYSNALLLTRLTGIRIGECIHLPLDCLRQIGPEQWALHVPLGKLHTERLVPLDPEGLRLLKRFRNCVLWLRLVVWRNPKTSSCFEWAVALRCFKCCAWRWRMPPNEPDATDSKPISPHRLRHTWATELLNCGIGLPALMKLMGHKSIQMTLRYLKVAQPDLQREFYRARQNSTQSYSLPSLSVSTATPDLPGIRQALAATRHLLEMYRRQFSDDKTRRRLQRLDHRLLAITQQLQNIATPEK
jgi:integrase